MLLAIVSLVFLSMVTALPREIGVNNLARAPNAEAVPAPAQAYPGADSLAPRIGNDKRFGEPSKAQCAQTGCWSSNDCYDGCAICSRQWWQLWGATCTPGWNA